MITHPQKHMPFEKQGDTIEFIVRDSMLQKRFQEACNTHNRKELERILKDLKDKGVDLIGVIRRKMIDGSGWFD